MKASIWKDGDGFQAVVTAPERDDAVALAGVVVAGIGTQLSFAKIASAMAESTTPDYW